MDQRRGGDEYRFVPRIFEGKRRGGCAECAVEEKWDKQRLVEGRRDQKWARSGASPCLWVSGGYRPKREFEEWQQRAIFRVQVPFTHLDTYLVFPFPTPFLRRGVPWARFQRPFCWGCPSLNMSSRRRSTSDSTHTSAHGPLHLEAGTSQQPKADEGFTDLLSLFERIERGEDSNGIWDELTTLQHKLKLSKPKQASKRPSTTAALERPSPERLRPPTSTLPSLAKKTSPNPKNQSSHPPRPSTVATLNRPSPTRPSPSQKQSLLPDALDLFESDLISEHSSAPSTPNSDESPTYHSDHSPKHGRQGMSVALSTSPLPPLLQGEKLTTNTCFLACR